jgi:hypothetical protein
MLKYAIAHFEVKVDAGIGITNNVECLYVSFSYFICCAIEHGGTWMMGWYTSSKLYRPLVSSLLSQNISLFPSIFATCRSYIGCDTFVSPHGEVTPLSS